VEEITTASTDRKDKKRERERDKKERSQIRKCFVQFSKGNMLLIIII